MANDNIISQISQNVGLSVRDVVRIVNSAPLRYRVYTIPKRNGGARIIAHPAKELKLIQRYLVAAYLNRLPVSRAAQAYVKGRSIYSNAVMHSHNAIVLKLDFTDFFHSIAPEDIIERMKDQFEFDQLSQDVFRLSLFWKDTTKNRLCLSIGAPSSPVVSNIVMRELDEGMLTSIAPSDLIYTRYADDVTISGPSFEDVLKGEAIFRLMVAESTSPRLTFNDEKRGVYSRAMKRMVTGLKLTPDGRVSMGRERKRLVSAGIHRAQLGKSGDKALEQLRGWLAFANAVDPAFLVSMRHKYGRIVDDLLRRPFRAREAPE